MKRWRGLGRLGLDKSEAGYTITEVMVVLAVSTVMFAAVVVSFQGRQARTEFNQAVRNFEAKLQTTTTEVFNGTYQTSDCSVAPNNGRPNFNSAANSGGCIFLGKVLRPDGARSEILTLIGRREYGNPARDVETLAQAEGAVSPAIDTYTHSYQLQITRIVRLSDGTTRLNAIGFMNPISGGLSNTNVRGDQRQPVLYGLVTPGTFSGGLVDTAFYQPIPEGAIICMLGQNGQRAEIRVGEANSQTMLIAELDTPNTGVCRDA